VTILDSNNSPVEGATVSGYWSGATDTDSAVTDGAGIVMVYSGEETYIKKTTPPLTFTFTVDSVSHDTLEWEGTGMSGTETYP
jgi:hypothetical protein